MGKRITISLPDDLAAAIEQQAAKQGRSQSNVVLRCLQAKYKTKAKARSFKFGKRRGRANIKDGRVQIGVNLAVLSSPLDIPTPEPFAIDLKMLDPRPTGFVVAKDKVVVEYGDELKKTPRLKPKFVPEPSGTGFPVSVEALKRMRPFCQVAGLGRHLEGILLRDGFAYAVRNERLMARMLMSYDGPEVVIPWAAIDMLPDTGTAKLIAGKGMYLVVGDEWVYAEFDEKAWGDVYQYFPRLVPVGDVGTGHCVDLKPDEVTHVEPPRDGATRYAWRSGDIEGFVTARD